MEHCYTSNARKTEKKGTRDGINHRNWLDGEFKKTKKRKGLVKDMPSTKRKAVISLLLELKTLEATIKNILYIRGRQWEPISKYRHGQFEYRQSEKTFEKKGIARL